jgi:hypothetical protein
MLVFGGQIAGANELSDVWSLSLGAPSSWEELFPDSTPPPARSYHTTIYDPLRDRLVVFGGRSTLGGTTFRDAWSLWLSPTLRWERIEPHGTAPPFGRQGHTAIYDPVRDRMVVYGAGTTADDVWALTFADTTWSRVITTNPPPRRSFHTAVYDPARDVMTVFGGNDGNLPLSDVWDLDLASRSWTQRNGAPLSPPAHQNHTAIRDTLFDRMMVFGGANVTEPSWALTFDPVMRWSPDRPVANSPQTLTLPRATVGDVVSRTFFVGNEGLRLLHLSELRAPPSMQVSRSGPFDLSWQESAPETLTFAADSAGAFADSLVLVSNDPNTPRRQVALSFEVLALDFSAHVLGDPAEVPLGTSFVVVTTPDPGVGIQGATLFYRVAGPGGAFDSLAFTPLATDFIASVPAVAVTENGVEYYVRVRNKGFEAMEPPGAPTTVFTQAVTPPAAMSAVPRPTSGSDFLVGREVDVDVVLEQGTLFVSGNLHYRAGGSANEQIVALTPGVAGRPFATIPAEAVGPRGVEYWVDATTSTSVLRFPEAAPATAPLRTTVQNLVEPAEHPAGRYRLLGVPLDFGSDFVGNLSDLLTDQLGTYDVTRWRAFRFDAASQQNIEITSPPATAFRPDSGRAFWLVTRDPHRVDTKPVTGRSTPTDGPFPVPLEPGWNLVANPFDFPVAWTDVGGTTNVTDLVAFDPLLGSTGGYSDVTPAVLEPFTGYFIRATAAGTLAIPPREASTSIAARTGSTADTDDRAWRLHLTATSPRAVDASSSFGVASGAWEGTDRLDGARPPNAPGAWVQASFVPGGESSQRLRRDLRDRDAAGHTWHMEVRSDTPGEPVSVEIAGNLARGVALRIVDQESGEWLDVPRDASSDAIVFRHRILSRGERPYHLSIVAGQPEYVERITTEQATIPARLTLGPASPNPFRWATELGFGLPRATRVDFEIFDIQGQRVAAPLHQAEFGPGFHSVLWEGRRRDGSPAPSGFYLMRVTAGGETRTVRALLVR